MSRLFPSHDRWGSSQNGARFDPSFGPSHRCVTESPMNRLSSLVIVAALAVGCTPASPEQAAIRGAAAALGGADRLLALKAMTIEGSGSAPNAGQNRMPDDELPVWKVNAYTRTVDLANGRTRVRQDREAQFLFAGATRQQQTQ